MNPRSVAIALVTILVVVGCILVWLRRAPSTTWDGGATRTVAVTVYAKDNGVLSGARVTYKYPSNDPTGGGRMNPDFFDRVIWQGVTDSDGRVGFSQEFGAGGDTSFGGIRGRLVLANNIRVEAEGFRPFESPLELLADGRYRAISDKRPIEISVVLFPSG